MGEKLENIFNFLKLSDSLNTGGQPTEEQMPLVRDAGCQVVINLAPTTAENALPNEKATVESLSMEYIHIPVNFKNPTEADFQEFCAAMENNQHKYLFIHCAANMRVSAFMYLYRRIYGGWSHEQAQIDLHKIWKPNRDWQIFIDRVIKEKVNR